MSELHRLIEAAKRGDLEETRTVLQSHAEIINEKDEQGAMALHYAAFGGHQAVVKLLVEQGAEINPIDSRFGATPTGWAIEYLRELGGFLAIELDDLASVLSHHKSNRVSWIAGS